MNLVTRLSIQSIGGLETMMWLGVYSLLAVVLYGHLTTIHKRIYMWRILWHIGNVCRFYTNMDPIRVKDKAEKYVTKSLFDYVEPAQFHNLVIFTFFTKYTTWSVEYCFPISHVFLKYDFQCSSSSKNQYFSAEK